MVQVSQHAGLTREAAGGGVVAGKLEDHVLQLLGDVIHEEGGAGGAAAAAETHREPAAHHRTARRLQRIHHRDGDGGLGQGRRLDRAETLEDILHGCRAVQLVRTGGGRDQRDDRLGQLRADLGGVQRLAGVDTIDHLGQVRARRLAGEYQIGEGAESVDVERDRRGLLAAAQQLRGKVGPLVLLHPAGHVRDPARERGHGGTGGGPRRRRRRLAARPPVPDADLRCAVVSDNPDAERAERPVGEPAAVGVGQHLRDLAQEREPVGEGEAGGIRPDVGVEGLRGGVMLEDEGGPEVGADHVEGALDPGVPDAAGEREFALRAAFELRAVLGRGTTRQLEDPDAAGKAGHVRMLGLDVMPASALREVFRRGDRVLADLADQGRGDEAGRLDERGDLAGVAGFDEVFGVPWRGGEEAGEVRLLGEAGHVVTVQGEDAGTGDARQVDLGVPAVQDHLRTDERDHTLGLGRGDRPEQRREPFGLLVREDVRVALEHRRAARCGDKLEALLVARDAAVPALQFEDENPHPTDQEHIDLGGVPVRVDEGEVRPGVGDTVVGKQLTDAVQCLRLRRRGRLAEAHPPVRRRLHASPDSCVVCLIHPYMSAHRRPCGCVRWLHPATLLPRVPWSR